MNHLIIILHFLSFTSGIILMALINYIKPVKGPVIKYTLLADLFYTFFLLFDTINLYVRKNITEGIGIVNLFFNYGQFISSILGVYFLCLVTHTLLSNGFSDKVKRQYNRIAFSVIIVLTLIYALGQYITIVSHYLLYGVNILIFLSLGYCCLIYLRNSFKVPQDIRKIINCCLLVISVFIPFYFLTSIIYGLPAFMYKIPYWPAMYSLVNIIGIIFIPKHHSDIEDIPEAQKPEAQKISGNTNEIKADMYDKFVENYGITERELEIARYIADGYSNPEISEKLFISTNTVKNHIYNIYRKVGIKNRYELISILSQIQNSAETTNTVK